MYVQNYMYSAQHVHNHMALGGPVHYTSKWMSRIPNKIVLIGCGGSCTCTRDMMEYQLLVYRLPDPTLEGEGTVWYIPPCTGHSYPILTYMYHGPAWDCMVHPTMYWTLSEHVPWNGLWYIPPCTRDWCGGEVCGGALCACVMCLAVYMCILSFFFPDCKEGLQKKGGGEGTEEGNFCW